MDTGATILRAAERLFDRHGFIASGIDRVTTAAGVSSRTLYKHVGSKVGLMTAVLGERDRRFRRLLDVRTIDALFVGLEDWMRVEGARGCLFLRALGETGRREPEINQAVETQKTHLRVRIGQIVELELGTRDDGLTEQILVLFEGATATAMYRGSKAVASARDAARALLLAKRTS